MNQNNFTYFSPTKTRPSRVISLTGTPGAELYRETTGFNNEANKGNITLAPVLSLCIVILFLFPSYLKAQDTTRTFADLLFSQGQYQDAAVEYMRILFTDSTPVSPRTRLNLARCFLELKEYQQARSFLEAADTPTTELKEEKALLLARMYLAQDRYAQVISSLQGLTLPTALAWQGYSYVKLDSTQKALPLLEQIPAGDPFYGKTGKLIKLIKEPVPHRKKSYAAAGLLSLVPGAGHIYTGRTGDAVYTMLLVGMFGGLTYYYLDNGSPNRAIAAGTFCGLFYSGSIYGAIMGVRLFNRAEKQKFQKQADEIFRSAQ